MAKKVSILVLSVVMVITMMPFSVFADEVDGVNMTDTGKALSIGTNNTIENSIVDDFGGSSSNNSSKEKPDRDNEIVSNLNSVESVTEVGASVNGIEYIGLQNAIDTANSGDTIVLDDDCTLTDAVTITKSLTIDLDGNTIYGNSEDVLIVDDGSVTIKDGNISNIYEETLAEDHNLTCCLANNDTSLSLNNVYFYIESATESCCAVYAGDEATLKVNYCDIDVCGDEDNEDADILGVWFADDAHAVISSTEIDTYWGNAICCAIQDSATVSATNCAFFGNADEGHAFYIADDGYVLVSSGDYGGVYNAVCLSGYKARMTIKTGWFYVFDDDYSAFWNGYYETYTSNVSIASGYTSSNAKWRSKGPDSVSFGKKPVSTKLTKLYRGKGRITVKWSSKGSKVSGYVVQVATNKSFTKNRKTVYLYSGKSKSKTIKSLKRRKTYYVRVCTYKYDEDYDAAYLSSWSGVKKIKTK